MPKREIKQRIMITRPAHQAGALAQAIKTAGGDAFLFPTLEILATELSDENKEKIAHSIREDSKLLYQQNRERDNQRKILSQKIIT